MYLWTSECVAPGHPDKVADQVADAILDAYLASDPTSKVAVETLVTTDLVVVAGEVTSDARPDVEAVVRQTIADIGYSAANGFDPWKCEVVLRLHRQSSEIHRAVVGQQLGAGDQGIMFGYATIGTPNYMPVTIYLARRLVRQLVQARADFPLCPDAKTQVTVAFGDDDRPDHVDTVVISTQHAEGVRVEQVREFVRDGVVGWLVSTLSALRWMLRGLSADKAIRKVEVDREIGHEIAARRKVLFEEDEWE